MAEPIDRRRLLSRFVPELLEHARDALEEGAPPTPRRRPPGAIAEAEFLARCTKCNDCSAACPEGAIFVLSEHVGRGAGTPVLVPDERPCLMCVGFPCAAACETGALRVPETSVVRLGAARVRRDLCLPYRGPECGACAGLCPDGAESALRLRLGRPEIEEAACIGCGRCIEACPTAPKAIELLPLA